MEYIQIWIETLIFKNYVNRVYDAIGSSPLIYQTKNY